MSLVDQERVCRILKKVPTFSDLYEDEYRALAHACGAESYRPGDVIFREGDSGNKLYLLLAGAVDIRTERAGHIVTLEPFDLFGEIAVVEPINRVATAEATVKTTVLTLTRRALEELQLVEPRAAFLVMRNIATSLAAKLTGTNDLIAPSVGRKPVTTES